MLVTGGALNSLWLDVTMEKLNGKTTSTRSPAFQARIRTAYPRSRSNRALFPLTVIAGVRATQDGTRDPYRELAKPELTVQTQIDSPGSWKICFQVDFNGSRCPQRV